MSGSVNKAIIIGNLGADPEMMRTQDGKLIATLSVATSRSWKDRHSGERRERTEWHRVVIFTEGLAKIAEQYLRKGSKVYVEGQVQTRKWVDSNGAERYSTEIALQGFNSTLHLLDRKTDQSAGAGSSYQERKDGNAPGPGAATRPAGNHDTDDDIPF